MAFTGVERQQAWPPRDPAEHNTEWMPPASPWTYNNDGPNPALVPSNTQHLRSRKRGTAGVSTVPPYHPDYEPAQHEYNDDDYDDDDDDEGERFAEYEKGRRRIAHVRHGSEGYEVRSIDREQLLAEYIATRGQEAGHYRRYVPEPPSEPESGGEEEGRVEVGEVDRDRDQDQDDYEEDDEEPLAVRVEKWRSGEAIS